MWERPHGVIKTATISNKFFKMLDMRLPLEYISYRIFGGKKKVVETLIYNLISILVSMFF